MPRCSLSKNAERDLDDIWDYISTQSVSAADRFVLRLREEFRLIAEMPMMGRRRLELGEDIRSFPVDEYVVFYRVRRPRTIIMRVVKAAMDITLADIH